MPPPESVAALASSATPPDALDLFASAWPLARQASPDETANALDQFPSENPEVNLLQRLGREGAAHTAHSEGQLLGRLNALLDVLRQYTTTQGE